MPHDDRERLLITHAMATDQLLRSYLNGDEQTKYWTRSGETRWILLWSFMGVLMGFIVRENPGVRLLITAGRKSQEQMDAYIDSLLRVLRHHHAHADEMVLFNWKSDCEPVMLSDDLIVDVDRRIYHDGAIFLERRFPRLKETYRRGHLDDTAQFDPLRWSLSELYTTMVNSYPEGSEERQIIEDNCRFGAAIDLAILALRRELGRL